MSELLLPMLALADTYCPDIHISITILLIEFGMSTYDGPSYACIGSNNSSLINHMSPNVDKRVTQLLRNTGLLSTGDIDNIYSMPFQMRKVFVDLCRLGQVI